MKLVKIHSRAQWSLVGELYKIGNRVWHFEVKENFINFGSDIRVEKTTFLTITIIKYNLSLEKHKRIEWDFLKMAIILNTL